MNWAKKQRLEWLNNRISCFNRKDLCEEFEISIPQASKDIKDFLNENPNAFVYDSKKKAYYRIIKEGHTKIYSLDDMKAHIRTHIPNFNMATQIMRRLK